MKILKQTFYVAVSDEDFEKRGIDCIDEVVDQVDDIADLGIFEVVWGPVEIINVSCPDPVALNRDESNMEEVGRSYEDWSTFAKGLISRLVENLKTSIQNRIGGMNA
jgi:hypothetical protein